MDRYIIKEEIHNQYYYLKSLHSKPVTTTTNAQGIHTNIQAKFHVDSAPLNEVVVYPWRRWYKSDHNIN
jgi:hypothetical protein